jgi:hypothetical protein
MHEMLKLWAFIYTLRMEEIKNIVEEISGNFPHIKVVDITEHEGRCHFCDIPNVSLSIRFMNNLGTDENGNFSYSENENIIIEINIHNYIEVGEYERIEGKYISLHGLSLVQNFMSELEKKLINKLN